MYGYGYCVGKYAGSGDKAKFEWKSFDSGRDKKKKNLEGGRSSLSLSRSSIPRDTSVLVEASQSGGFPSSKDGATYLIRHLPNAANSRV